MITKSIIIPAYAEEPLIADTLRRLYSYMDEKGLLQDTEVIVVTAEAPDNTVAIVAKEIKPFPHQQHIQPGARVGKGRDVKVGMAAARSDKVLYMDADLATPLTHIEHIFSTLEERAGMVLGVRDLGSMHKTFSRKISSLMSNLLIRMTIGWNIADSQCGFKAFDKSTIDLLLSRSVLTGWGFDFEFMKIAKIKKVPISMIKINDWKDPKPEGAGLAGSTQFSAMKNTLKELIIVKKNQYRGKYK